MKLGWSESCENNMCANKLFSKHIFQIIKRSGLLGQFHLFAWVKTQNIWAKSLVWAYVISHLGNLQQHEIVQSLAILKSEKLNNFSECSLWGKEIPP